MRNRVLKAGVALGLLTLGACAKPADPGGDDFNGGVAQPPEVTASAEDGIITSLAVTREDGKAVDAFMTYHPVKVKMTVQATRPVADHVVHVGLVEKGAPGVAREDLRTCLLGAFDASYGVEEGQEKKEVTIERDLVIPADCLAGKSEKGTFNVWVGVGARGAVDNAALGTQFFNEEQLDLSDRGRNGKCIGPDGKAGCVIDVAVTTSRGENVSIDALSPTSHVGVVSPRCAVDFAQPLATVNGTIRLFGAASHTGTVKGEEAQNALSQPVDISYSLCPRGDDGKCVAGTDYTALAVGAPGEGQSVKGSLTVDRLVNAEPHVFNHGVFVAPESDACTKLTKSEAGTWSKYSTFNLRVCEKAPFAEQRNGGEASADDCKVEPIQVVVAQSTHSGAADSWQLYKDYSNSAGNDVVNVSASFGTDNNLNLSGASTHNWANAGVGGWFGFNLFNIWADAAAYVAIVGSGANAGVQMFGQTLWQYQNQINEIHYAYNPSFSQQACVGYNFGVAGLGFNISACAVGSAGLNTGLDVVAKDGNAGAPFASATKIGNATVHVTPWASLQLNASAWADIGVSNGGITGTLTLLNVSLPATGDLKWGLVSLSPVGLVVTADARLDINFTTMSGNIHGWVDVATPDWCSCGSWCPGYPCTSWSTVWSEDLVSWGGWSGSWNLLSAGGQMGFGNVPAGTTNTCAHDVHAEGAPLASGCASCATSICSYDPYCCQVWWDGICTWEASYDGNCQ